MLSPGETAPRVENTATVDELYRQCRIIRRPVVRSRLKLIPFTAELSRNLKNKRPATLYATRYMLPDCQVCTQCLSDV